MSQGKFHVSKFLLFLLTAIIIAGCSNKRGVLPEFESVSFLELSEENFEKLVINSDATVVVLFDDGSAASSVLGRQHAYAANEAKFFDEVIFARYSVGEESIKQKYELSEMPAISLYSKGFLIDRILGKPKNYNEAVDLEKDFNLWVTNTVAAHAAEANPAVIYRFSNSISLNVGVR